MQQGNRGMRARFGVAFTWTVAVALSCGEPLSPLSVADSPRELTVEAVGVAAVRLTWKPVQGANIAGYQVQRRADQQGEFTALAATVPQSTQLVTYLDTDVKPETFYGYRVVTITSFGDVSTPSVASGARTPPPPGVVVSTQSESPNALSQDPDGYRVTLSGPDTASAVIGLAAEHRFAPLRPGTYKAVLHGVIGRCDVDADSVRTVVVADTGVHTLTPVSYLVRCRDQSRGRVVGIVTATGDSADASGFQLRATGVADDAALPDSQRIVAINAAIPSSGGAKTFDNLRPGAYEVELRGLDAHCTNFGTVNIPARTTSSVAVKAGSTDTVRFAVSCDSQRPDQSSRPLVWRNSWSAGTAAPQQKVYLTVALDASARSQLRIAAAQGELRYDPTVLRFEKAEASPDGGLTGVTANGNTSGFVAFGSVDNEGVGISGVVPVARIEFTVIGDAGASAITRTKITEVTTADVQAYEDSTRIVEDTVLVGAVAAKQPPVAMANGPYAGAVGAPLTFSSTGSNDPDGGSIAAWRWSFGDGSPESTQSSPTKSYAAAGTYTVTLTVTDDEGATATAQTTATITTGAPPPPPATPLVWRSSWSSPTAAPQQKVLLTISVDATARPQVKVAAVQSELRYDASVLRFEKAQPAPSGLSGLSANGTTQGLVAIGSIDNNGVGLAGVVGVAQIEFTVIGAAGTSAATRTTLAEVTDPDLIAYKDSTGVVEATLTVAGSGGTVKQPPVAMANGPYSGTTGTGISFTAAGSSDPDGGTVTYKWTFGDGSPEATGAAPTWTYASAGTYTVALTVTDDEGVSTTAQTTATVVAAAPVKPLLWSYIFSPVSTADSIVVMTVSYDLRADLTDTPTPEALQSFVVDSLSWNPAVLRFFALNFGPGGSGSQTSTSSGKLTFRGSPQPGLNAGLLTIATIRFKVVGNRGQSSTTRTWLGPLLGPGSFPYNTKTELKEETFVVP